MNANIVPKSRQDPGEFLLCTGRGNQGIQIPITAPYSVDGSSAAPTGHRTRQSTTIRVTIASLINWLTMFSFHIPCHPVSIFFRGHQASGGLLVLLHFNELRLEPKFDIRTIRGFEGRNHQRCRGNRRQRGSRARDSFNSGCDGLI